MNEEEIEAIILENNSTVEEQDNEEKKESLRLNQRLQYYQQYVDGNHPDTMNSSDDDDDDTKEVDPSREGRGSLERKSPEGSEDRDQDDEGFQANMYAPLEEGALTLQEDDDEFGEFVTTALDNHMNEIDSILNTDNPAELERNVLFSRLVRDDRRYVQSIQPNNTNSNHLVIQDSELEERANEDERVTTTDSEIREQENLDSPKRQSAVYRSISPLSQEKVQKIKSIMAGIKIKPPSSGTTLALLDSVELSRLRLGDELPLTKNDL